MKLLEFLRGKGFLEVRNRCVVRGMGDWKSRGFGVSFEELSDKRRFEF